MTSIGQLPQSVKMTNDSIKTECNPLQTDIKMRAWENNSYFVIRKVHERFY